MAVRPCILRHESNENPEQRSQALVDAGADIEARDEDNWTPLHLRRDLNENLAVVQTAAGCGGRHFVPGVRGAMSNGFGGTPLHIAATFNENPEVAQALVDAGADT